MSCAEHTRLRLSRRSFTKIFAGTAALGAFLPGQSFASSSGAAAKKNFVLINIRGGLDTLHAVIPYASPYINGLRANLLPPAVGTPGGMIDIGHGFAIHPLLPNFAAMIQAGEAIAVHAVGNFPAQAERSHFAGQDYLASGAPVLLPSGWMNRVLPALPSCAIQPGIVFGLEAAAVMQGSNPVAGWSPYSYPAAPATLKQIMLQTVSADPILGPAFSIALSDEAFLAGLSSTAPAGSGTTTKMASAASTLLNMPGGPNAIYIEYDEVDTHTNQVTRFAEFAADFDQALLTFKNSLGAAWDNTVIMTMSEFGRTAAENGTGGTDHGTAFSVFLAGGAVSGAGLAGTFPGLSPAQLYQGRDLAPTVDFVAVAMGVLRDHLGLNSAALATAFPDSASETPMGGLIRAGS